MEYFKPQILIVELNLCHNITMSLTGGTESQDSTRFLQQLETEADDTEW